MYYRVVCYMFTSVSFRWSAEPKQLALSWASEIGRGRFASAALWLSLQTNDGVSIQTASPAARPSRGTLRSRRSSSCTAGRVAPLIMTTFVDLLREDGADSD